MPQYAALFEPQVFDTQQYSAVTTAEFSATYASWHNEVCANYEAEGAANAFSLVTGGSQPLGRPVLPDESARTLTLP